MTTRSLTDRTALCYSAVYAHLEVGLLLCSRGADLMAVNDKGCTALDLYGIFANLSDELKQKHRAALLGCFRIGPHLLQVKRRADDNFGRRLSFMLVITGCDFTPLLARQLALLSLNPPLPPDAKIPHVEIATVAQKRAFLNMAVFGHGGLVKPSRAPCEAS